ncbi:MAG: putative Ribokinase [Parcubacteria group bacterium Gr01-1014_18]|nr:MAG: putative Ribokinase [Parcubacteria group bacterium Greene0416_36]TSC80207.1 MAG: putative Ribokinase [Parcubacteria group bacterium Gr01-1014_18]TSC98389.1 MAG: putative Ribokinase [Parcubacteria group bacterium Greene1014_20]TSD06930.1 MAG: putative Ribokinase [Parcubacteria group bacterium Greene0714_2]
MPSKKNNPYLWDMISIGDSGLDVFLEVAEAGVLYNASADQSLFCLSYLDTVPVDGISYSVAGNAANNAVGSSRLKMKTACYTELGSDLTAEKIVRQFEKEKVSSKFAHIHKGSESNYTVVINYNAERTQLSFRRERDYKMPLLEPSRWAYLTAMGHFPAKLYKDLYGYITRCRTKLGFNPGVEQIREGLESMKEILTRTSVLFLNKEEARQLFSFEMLREVDDTEELKALLFKAWDFGPEKVVITDGGNGAYAFDGKKYWHVGVLPVTVLEKTGAGDAFATATLAALFHGEPFQEALVWGALNGASVVQSVGPQAGLLSLTSINQMRKKHHKHRAREI